MKQLSGKTFLLLLLFSALLLPAAPARKLRPAAATGDEAPALQVTGWLRGDAFELPAGGNEIPLTVLLFWTTTEKGVAGFNKVAALVEKFEPQKVRFAAIGVDDSDALEKFLKNDRSKLAVAADSQLKTTMRYMRRDDRLPFAAVIDRSGRIIWRGDAEYVEPLLNEVLAGKFDLEESIAREKFSDAVTAALRIRDYPTVLRLLNEELEKYPDNAELLTFRINLLGGPLKQPEECTAAVNEALEKLPKNVRIYLSAIDTFRKAHMDAELIRLYDRFAADFADRPGLLLTVARKEMEQAIDRIKLNSVYKLTNAAWNAPKFENDLEKGAAATEYARALYYCGRPDLAVDTAKEALKLLKGTPQYEQAKQNLIFFNNVLLLSRQIK